ncbi:DinB family protein [Shimazuella sp. AN120528]|uniref:DinB family protein n=1 Tax=Shimazuella soli TaxID=1892854 RepID=UPI001F0EEAB4|nr:DinB family protein [Shimazuella soli]MCH5584795.1 DinB family protein [Shimazuella soli]
MNRKDIFLQQLTACFDQNHWFVSIKNALDGLTEEQALWKSGDKTNSIWEIVNHLNFWNKLYYDRFQGVFPDNVDDNYNTFQSVDGSSWQETVDRCYQILSDWREALENSEEVKLDALPKENYQNNWAEILSNVMIHNAYHLGQIVHIRKEQHAWDAKQGVKG